MSPFERRAPDQRKRLQQRSTLLSTKLCFAAAAQAMLMALAAQAAERIVTGYVYYKDKEPASGSAVQLEDRETMQVVSRLTDREGHYRFIGLNPDREYEIRATKKGYWSKSRVLSRFSSRLEERVDLYLRPESDKD